MNRKLKQILQEIDPNLTIISHTRRNKNKRRMTSNDWDNAAVPCPVCGQPTTRLVGLHALCPQCSSKEKGVYLEETVCQKCERAAAKVTALSDGLANVKVICPHCGTYAVNGTGCSPQS